MADRPILFSGPMVRALLDGRKTQTRRIANDVPPQPEANCHPRNKPKHTAPYLDAYCSEYKTAMNPRGMSVNWCWWQVDDRQCLPTFKVKAAPGDRLWVKERAQRNPYLWEYHADGAFVEWPGREPLAHFKRDDCPSIHLPKKASRLTLIVTDVNVQRLQDISVQDALAEGWPGAEAAQRMPATKWYRTLWEQINGEGSWTANPWVVAYTFTVQHGNIDQIGRAAA